MYSPDSDQANCESISIATAAEAAQPLTRTEESKNENRQLKKMIKNSLLPPPPSQQLHNNKLEIEDEICESAATTTTPVMSETTDSDMMRQDTIIVAASSITTTSTTATTTSTTTTATTASCTTNFNKPSGGRIYSGAKWLLSGGKASRCYGDRATAVIENENEAKIQQLQHQPLHQQSQSRRHRRIGRFEMKTIWNLIRRHRSPHRRNEGIADNDALFAAAKTAEASAEDTTATTLTTTTTTTTTTISSQPQHMPNAHIASQWSCNYRRFSAFLRGNSGSSSNESPNRRPTSSSTAQRGSSMPETVLLGLLPSSAELLRGGGAAISIATNAANKCDKYARGQRNSAPTIIQKDKAEKAWERMLKMKCNEKKVKRKNSRLMFKNWVGNVCASNTTTATTSAPVAVASPLIGSQNQLPFNDENDDKNYCREVFITRRRDIAVHSNVNVVVIIDKVSPTGTTATKNGIDNYLDFHADYRNPSASPSTKQPPQRPIIITTASSSVSSSSPSPQHRQSKKADCRRSSMSSFESTTFYDEEYACTKTNFRKASIVTSNTAASAASTTAILNKNFNDASSTHVGNYNGGGCGDRERRSSSVSTINSTTTTTTSTTTTTNTEIGNEKAINKNVHKNIIDCDSNRNNQTRSRATIVDRNNPGDMSTAISASSAAIAAVSIVAAASSSSSSSSTSSTATTITSTATTTTTATATTATSTTMTMDSGDGGEMVFSGENTATTTPTNNSEHSESLPPPPQQSQRYFRSTAKRTSENSMSYNTTSGGGGGGTFDEDDDVIDPLDFGNDSATTAGAVTTGPFGGSVRPSWATRSKPDSCSSFSSLNNDDAISFHSIECGGGGGESANGKTSFDISRQIAIANAAARTHINPIGSLGSGGGGGVGCMSGGNGNGSGPINYNYPRKYSLTVPGEPRHMRTLHRRESGSRSPLNSSCGGLSHSELSTPSPSCSNSINDDQSSCSSGALNAIELNRKCTLSVDSLLLKTASVTRERARLHHGHHGDIVIDDDDDGDDEDDDDDDRSKTELYDAICEGFRSLNAGGDDNDASSKRDNHRKSPCSMRSERGHEDIEEHPSCDHHDYDDDDEDDETKLDRERAKIPKRRKDSVTAMIASFLLPDSLYQKFGGSISSDRINQTSSSNTNVDKASASRHISSKLIFSSKTKSHSANDTEALHLRSGETSSASCRNQSPGPTKPPHRNRKGSIAQITAVSANKIVRLLRRTHSAGCSKDVPSYALFLKEEKAARKKQRKERKQRGRRKQAPALEDMKQRLPLRFLRRRHTDSSLHSSSIRPTHEELEKWSKSFEDLMANRYGCALFRAFLSQQHSEENIEFWIACEEYKKSRSSKLQHKARKIFDNFLIVGSRKEVNLEPVMREQIQRHLTAPAPPSKAMFDKAQLRIRDLLADPYRRFLESSLYTDLLRSAKERIAANPTPSAAALAAAADADGATSEYGRDRDSRSDDPIDGCCSDFGGSRRASNTSSNRFPFFDNLQSPVPPSAPPTATASSQPRTRPLLSNASDLRAEPLIGRLDVEN